MGNKANQVMSEEKLRQIIQEKCEEVRDKNHKAAMKPELFEQVCPALHIPPAPHRSNTAILLIHGLLDSASIMHSLYSHYQAQNKVTVNFLLKGHGTASSDLLDVDYSEWIIEVREVIKSLATLCDKVVVIGLSTGAIIATHLALEGAPIDGLIMFAPAFSVGLTQKLGMGLHKLRSLIKPLSGPWLIKKEESEPAKYQSIAANGVIQLLTLANITKRQLRAKGLELPVLSILSEDDETISNQATRHYLSYATHKNNHELLYKRAPSSTTDKQTIINSTDKADNILNYSHICLPVAPSHPLFGRQRFAGVPAPLGAVSLYQLLRFRVARLTYNPKFDTMVPMIDAFIDKI